MRSQPDRGQGLAFPGIDAWPRLQINGVMNCGGPGKVRYLRPLAITDRDVIACSKRSKDLDCLWGIQPPMERYCRRRIRRYREGQCQVVEVRMDDVELIGAAIDFVE